MFSGNSAHQAPENCEARISARSSWSIATCPLAAQFRSMMVHCNYALMVVSRRSTPLGKSDRPIQDELLTVNCESEAERFRGENRLCKKIPLSPFTAQLVQLCQRAKRAAK